MSKVFLQDMADDIHFDDLSVNWSAFDFGTFSKSKRLWDYQQKAVENAIKVLWKYYEDFADYQKGDGLRVNQAITKGTKADL